MSVAKDLIDSLNLKPHPEGGFYRETYRAEGVIAGTETAFPAGRNFATAIYFMLVAGNFSAFHRIRSDETWHFYSGDPALVIEINKLGVLKQTVLGPYTGIGQVFQHTVPAGSWFASRVFEKGSWSLTGCTVAPGFDFADFELAERNNLMTLYPLHKEHIVAFTRS